MPDFLKDKENFKNNGNKHRRIKQHHESQQQQHQQQIEPIPMARNTFDTSVSSQLHQRPLPAPRLSITKSANNIRSPTTTTPAANVLDTVVEKSPSIECHGENGDTTMIFEHQQPRTMVRTLSSSPFITDTNYTNNNHCNENNNNNSFDANASDINTCGRGPPPLPPKPKVLPMKPSNWGQQHNNNNNNSNSSMSGGNHLNELSRSISGDSNNSSHGSKLLKNNFLDQSTNSGSFV